MKNIRRKALPPGDLNEIVSGKIKLKAPVEEGSGAPPTEEDKTTQAMTKAQEVVVGVLEERGLSKEGIKLAIVEVVNELVADRFKRLEDVQFHRLATGHGMEIEDPNKPIEFVPGLRGSKEARDFSLLRALGGKLFGTWGDGPEKEVLKAVEGSELFQKFISTEVDSQSGFFMPPEVIGDVVELLKPMSILPRLGVRNLPNMRRWPLRLPKKTGTTTAYWVGEGGEPTASGVTTGMLESRPRKLGTVVEASKESLQYTEPSMEAFIREEILENHALELDRAYFKGLGAQNEPMGLSNWPGIKTASFVDPSSDKPGVTWAMLQTIINKLEGANVTSPERWKWTMNSDVKFALSKIVDADKRPWWTWDPSKPSPTPLLAGYPHFVTNKLTTVSSIADLFFHDPYQTLWVGWGGLLIEANPWAQGKKQIVEIYGFQMVDFIVRQPSAICLMNDFDVSKY